MQICRDKRHEALVYAGGLCPLCVALNEIERLKKRLEEMRIETRRLEDEITSRH